MPGVDLELPGVWLEFGKISAGVPVELQRTPADSTGVYLKSAPNITKSVTPVELHRSSSGLRRTPPGVQGECKVLEAQGKEMGLIMYFPLEL